MARRSWHDRVFARLLRMFPAEFRGDFGQAMADDFRDQREDAARTGGQRSLLRVWLLTLGGFLRGAPREHLDVLRRDAGCALRLLRRRPALAAATLLTLTVGIGLNSAVLSVIRTFWTNNMLVRTTADPRDVLPEIRAVMRQLDPQQALTRIETLEERLSESIAPRRFNLRLIGLFSAVAMALAMLGIYGVVAESVAQRVPEIGVRMALGARGPDVVRLILGQGVWMVVIGIGLGVAGAAALNRVMSGLVFGVRTTDPASYTVAAVCLMTATLVACVIPARRAARIDPVQALRQD
jgi:hypothetical protein